MGCGSTGTCAEATDAIVANTIANSSVQACRRRTCLRSEFGWSFGFGSFRVAGEEGEFFKVLVPVVAASDERCAATDDATGEPNQRYSRHRSQLGTPNSAVSEFETARQISMDPSAGCVVTTTDVASRQRLIRRNHNRDLRTPKSVWNGRNDCTNARPPREWEKVNRIVVGNGGIRSTRRRFVCEADRLKGDVWKCDLPAPVCNVACTARRILRLRNDLLVKRAETT